MLELTNQGNRSAELLVSGNVIGDPVNAATVSLQQASIDALNSRFTCRAKTNVRTLINWLEAAPVSSQPWLSKTARIHPAARYCIHLNIFGIQNLT